MLQYKINFTLFLSLLLLISCSHSRYGTDKRRTPPIKHDLAIKKGKDRWEVKTPRVTKGDTLIWVAPESSDLSFQFPSNIDRYLEPINKNESLSDGYLKYLKAGDSLRMIVKRRAPSFRILEYAIFVIRDSEYAEGDTPPEIIFEW